MMESVQEDDEQDEYSSSDTDNDLVEEQDVELKNYIELLYREHKNPALREMVDLREYLSSRQDAIVSHISRSDNVSVIRRPRNRKPMTLKTEFLASGSFGCVFRFRFSDIKKEFVVKITIPTTDFEYLIPRDIEESAKTDGVPSRVVAPFIFETYPYGPKTSGGLKAMISEFCSHGTLYDALRREDTVNEVPDYAKFRLASYPDERMPMHIGMLLFRRMLSITARFEEPLSHGDHVGRCVVHNDLRHLNMVICDDGELKAIDFGLARYERPNKRWKGKIPFVSNQDRANLTQLLFMCFVGKTLSSDDDMLDVRDEHLGKYDQAGYFVEVQWARYKYDCLLIVGLWFDALYKRFKRALNASKKYAGNIRLYINRIFRLIQMANDGVLSKELIDMIDEGDVTTEVEGLEAAVSEGLLLDVRDEENDYE